VDNFLITYGWFVTKYNQRVDTDRQKETPTLDPSKQPLTEKNNGFIATHFFTSPAIASHTGGPYTSAPLNNRIDVKALV